VPPLATATKYVVPFAIAPAAAAVHVVLAGNVPPLVQVAPSIDLAVTFVPVAIAINVPLANAVPTQVAFGKVLKVAANSGGGVDVIFDKIPDPGSKPWLLEKSIWIVAIAPTFNVVPLAIVLVIDSLNVIAGYIVTSPPNAGVPAAETALICPPPALVIVKIQSFRGEIPPRSVPAIKIR
jgi:hypothetical protein